jgi:hypothetical protein
MGDKKEITQLPNVSRGPYPYYCTRRLGISSKSKLVTILLYLGVRGGANILLSNSIPLIEIKTHFSLLK